MSLQVWLPLTKDIRQQGLSEAIATNNGATYLSSGGKLGGTYSATASGQTITINFANLSTMLTNGKTYTLTCWVKPTGTPSSGWVIKLGTNSCGLWWAKSEARWVWNENDNGKRCANPTISADYTNWHHLAIVVDKTVSGKITTQQYVDGVLAAGYPGSTWDCSSHSQPAGTVITISPYVSQLNDIRLYDHCLSPMEVKELAKGLVLHYPLNRQGWGQENLVWDTHWDEISTKWSGWGSPSVREIVNTFGKKYLHVKSSDRWQGYSQNQAKRSGVGEITAGEKLTLSCWAYSNTTLTSYPCIGIHWTDGSSIIAQSWPLLTITTTPQKFTTVLTVPSGVSAFNIMIGNGSGTVSGVYEIWVADVKLERGEESTPWCPNSSDALATTMGLNSTTEYDCSGFCNNGTRTGTFTWTSDTPKYQVSTNFNGSNNQIHLDGFGMGNIFSIACWVKVGDASGTKFIFQHGTASGYNSTQFGIHTSSEGNSYGIIVNKQYSSISGLSSITNWHHMVLTFDGTTAKYYFNGELKHSYTVSNALYSGTKLSLGAYNSNGNVPYKGLMSDFRIYATALSADDVKSLYQNSAYIDSSGNVYGAVHSEV